MAGYALKVKTKSGQQVLRNLSSKTTLRELKQQLCDISNIPLHHLHVLSGFPPKIFDLSPDDKSLEEVGLHSGDTLILEAKSEAEVGVGVSVIVPDAARPHVLGENLCAGILMKQVVPADNSCLFTSLYFVLNGRVENSEKVAPDMRQLIAESISRDKETYCEAILGKPNDEYCKWIVDDKSWGGAIELAVLSNHFGIEIDVVDTINGIINRFGEDQRYPHRVLLLFDGIHYDPLYMESVEGGAIQTIFQVEDENVLKDAEQLAKEAKSSRQFTDVDKFTLKCMICDTMISGQLQAKEHAESTGHQNFGEVK